MMEIAKKNIVEVQIHQFHGKEEGQTTGADWQWWFIGDDGRFGMRVQAKKINRFGQYSEILHKIGKTKRSQIDLLIDDADRQRLFPMYCFYNFWQDLYIPESKCCQLPRNLKEWGCSVADARSIKSLVDNNRRQKLSIKTIGPISWPWSCLVCINPYPMNDIDGFEYLHGLSLPSRVYRMAKKISGGEHRVEEPSFDLGNHISDLWDISTRGKKPDKKLLDKLSGVDGVAIFKEPAGERFFGTMVQG